MTFSKRMAIRVIAIVFLIAGVSVIVYPHIMQNRYDRQTKADYMAFITQADASGAKPADGTEANFQYAELYREMIAYNDRIRDEGQAKLTDPWSYEQASFNLAEYGFDEDIIGYISIPKIDVLLPVYLGASDDNMSKGATHLSQTSLPIGGDSNNCVICGHRGYWGAKMFKYLVDLEPGDEVIISNLWYTMTYRVTGATTIRDNDIDDIKIQDGKDMLTLFTCYYQADRKDRFVVYCERIVE